MELKKQVCSLELAKKLKELGVLRRSLWYWWAWHDDERIDLIHKDKDIGFGGGPSWSAFTVAELGEMLKEYWHRRERWLVQYEKGIEPWWWEKRSGGVVSSKTEADARAKMVIWLIENGYIKTGGKK